MERNNEIWKWFSKSGSSLAQCTRCKEEINIASVNVIRRLRLHLYKHIKENYVRKWFAVESGSVLVKCTHCDEKFNKHDIKPLRAHLYCKHGIIDKRKKLSLWLQKHYVDLGEYKAQCTYCKTILFYLNTTGNLNRHLKKYHFEKLTTIKTSRIKENWVRKWFSGESGSSLVKCTRCDEKLNEHDIRLLRAHLYKHGIIDKRKKLSLWLQKHYVDLGEYKAQCNYCENIYSYKSRMGNLNRHLKSVHLEKLITQTQHEDSNSSSDTELDRNRAESGVTSCSQMRQETGVVDKYAPSTSRSMDYVIDPYAENQSQELVGLPIQLSEQRREGTSDLDELVHWMRTHSEDALNLTQKLYDDLPGSMSSVMDSYSHHQSQEPPNLFLDKGTSVQLGEGTNALNELSYSVMAAEDAINLVPQLYDAPSTLRSTNYVMDPYVEHQSQEPPGFSVQLSQTRAQTGDFDEYAPSTSRLTDIMNLYEEIQSQGSPGFPVQSSEQTREQTGDFEYAPSKVDQDEWIML